MTTYEEIGQIFKPEDAFLFEWNFPNKWLLSKQPALCILSPRFCLFDSRWYLTLYPNGCVEHRSKGWIGLFLHRANRGPPKDIKYILEIGSPPWHTKITKTHRFTIFWDHSGEPRIFEKSTIKHLNFCIPFDVKITCRIIDWDTTIKEIPICLSCAVHTEVPDSVIDKENSKDENWSSLDIQEFTILRDRMKELFINGNDHDLTICVQDKEFRAHRNILSVRSPVFAMMLTHDTKENNTGTISIDDCDPDTFGEFLLYVYSGKTENLTSGTALQLYYNADKYVFPVLKQQCVSLLKTSLSITSICDIVLLAARHQEEELLEVASKFFATNMEAILVTVGWQTFMVQNPVEANELLIKSTKLLHPIERKLFLKGLRGPYI